MKLNGIEMQSFFTQVQSPTLDTSIDQQLPQIQILGVSPNAQIIDLGKYYYYELRNIPNSKVYSIIWLASRLNHHFIKLLRQTVSSILIDILIRFFTIRD